MGAHLPADESFLTIISESGKSFAVNCRDFLRESGYYRACVASGMRDSHSSTLTFDVLSDSSLEEVCTFLSGDLEQENLNYTSYNIDAGLEAAFYLQMDSMIDKYSRTLVSCLHHSTWFQTIDICRKYCLSLVITKALDFVCDNFQSCCKDKDFLCLLEEEITYIIKSDRTFADSEVVIFEAAIKWMSQDDVKILSSSKLLNEIRFELMNDIEMQECKSLLNSLDISTCLIDSICLLSHGIEPRQRCTADVLIALGGFTFKEFSTNRFQVFEISNMDAIMDLGKEKSSATFTRRRSKIPVLSFKSNKKQKLPETLCEHGACVLNGMLYVAGGQVHYCADGRYTTDKVYVFNPILQAWSSCSKMHVPRSLFYFGVLNGCIYAVSGYTAPNTDTATVERYIPKKDVWEVVAPLEVRVHELSGCSYNGFLYISGGFRGPDRGHVDLVWMYDHVLDEWIKKAPLLKARSYHAMIANLDKIYVVGGVRYLGNDRFEDIMDGEVYDTTFDQWTQVIQLYHPASCMSSVVVNDTLFLFGGHSFEKRVDHSMVQAIMLTNGEEASTSINESSVFVESLHCRENLKKVKTISSSKILYHCSVFQFEAQRIFYFSLCSMKLSRKFIDQFH